MAGKTPALPRTHFSLLAHELQAPLSLLRARLEAALEKPGCTRECHTLVTQCLEEVREMDQLVRDLLLLEEAKAGRVGFQSQRLDLAELAESAGNGFQVLARARGVSLRIEMERSLPVMGAPAQIERILTNLLDNATKYTAAGGTVRMTGRVEGSHAEIAVEDSGIGIASEAVPFIFEPFYQVDKQKSRQAGGVGLGLSIARALAEDSQGSLDVESLPGRGSRFVLRLPLVC